MVEAKTFVGPVFVVWMSEMEVTVVITFAPAAEPSLLPETGSNTSEPPDTMFVRLAPLAGAVTVMEKLVAAPLVKLAIGQVTKPLVKVNPLLAVTKVTPTGNESVTTRLVAVDGPRLVNAMV